MTSSTHTSSFPRSPLATPALDEAMYTELGQQLENYLAPLVDYCDQQPQDESLDLEQFRHGQLIRQALDALLRYDEATGRLLAYYRAAFTYAQQVASTCVPTLEQALNLPAPEPPESQPPVSSRPATPPVKPAPPAAAPLAGSEVHRVDIAAVQRFLDTPALRARAALPVSQRQALAHISYFNLPPHAQSR